MVNIRLTKFCLERGSSSGRRARPWDLVLRSWPVDLIGGRRRWSTWSWLPTMAEKSVSSASNKILYRLPHIECIIQHDCTLINNSWEIKNVILQVIFRISNIYITQSCIAHIRQPHNVFTVSFSEPISDPIGRHNNGQSINEFHGLSVGGAEVEAGQHRDRHGRDWDLLEPVRVVGDG